MAELDALGDRASGLVPNPENAEPDDRGTLRALGPGVLRQAAGVLTVRVLGALAAFGSSVVIGRTLGASGAGVYFIAISVVSIAATFGGLGLGLPTMRLVSVALGESEPSRVRGLVTKSLLMVSSASLLLGIAVIALAPVIAASFGKSSLEGMLRIMGLAVVPLALLPVLSRLLMAIQRAALAELVQRLGPHMVIAAGLLLGAGRLGDYSVGVYFGIAYLSMAMIAGATWRRLSPTAATSDSIPARDLLAPGLPLLFVATVGLIITWSDIMMIGALLPESEAGIYGAATRIAGVVSFVLVAAGTVMGPRFARMYAHGDIPRLSVAFQTSARWTGLVALLASILLLVLAKPILSLFGQEFRSGWSALSILILGQFINAAVGLVALVLAMSGRERSLMVSTLVAGTMNIVLNAILIPSQGITGAAVATAFAITALNLMLLVFVWRDLGIRLIGNARIRDASGSSRQRDAGEEA